MPNPPSDECDVDNDFFNVELAETKNEAVTPLRCFCICVCQHSSAPPPAPLPGLLQQQPGRKGGKVLKHQPSTSGKLLQRVGRGLEKEGVDSSTPAVTSSHNSSPLIFQHSHSATLFRVHFFQRPLNAVSTHSSVRVY